MTKVGLSGNVRKRPCQAPSRIPHRRLRAVLKDARSSPPSAMPSPVARLPHGRATTAFGNHCDGSVLQRGGDIAVARHTIGLKE